MRLLVPATTLNDAKLLLNSGADDIYVGTTSSLFNNYSFNGRACISKQGKHVLPTLDELKRICTYVHSKNGFVYFLANIPIVNETSKTFYAHFMRYIEAGVTAGADYIVLGNITSIKWVKNMYPDVKIVASSYLEVQNILALKMIEEMGVSQVVLSYQSTLEEIHILTKNTTLKIEVFGHGGCSFYVGSCNMFHELGEKIDIGYPCRATYSVINAGDCERVDRHLDCFKMCSLCKLKVLEDFGVYSLKIVGRDLHPDYILEIVKVYHRTLEMNRNGKEFTNQILPKWWKKAWCNPGGLCRYGREY